MKHTVSVTLIVWAYGFHEI